MTLFEIHRAHLRQHGTYQINRRKKTGDERWSTGYAMEESIQPEIRARVPIGLAVHDAAQPLGGAILS